MISGAQDGLRLEKTTGTTTTECRYVSGQLLEEIRNDVSEVGCIANLNSILSTFHFFQILYGRYK